MKDLEYNYIKRQVLTLIGVDLNCYKAPQMQRRLDAYLSRSEYPNWPKLFGAVRDDLTESSKLRDYLTINVSSFFRDPQKYSCLQASVLPDLLRRRGTLRVWSAGCSRGQEAYSLAMLLAEATVSASGHHILATDIDHSALKWARAGGPYTADDVTNISHTLRWRYFDTYRNNEYWVKEYLRNRISFQQHNLLADPITGKFDLIVCRNVVIYFQTEAKEKLYRRFYNALKPGGILFVGGTEVVPKATDMGFEAVSISFYRRKDTCQPSLKPSIS